VIDFRIRKAWEIFAFDVFALEHAVVLCNNLVASARQVDTVPTSPKEAIVAIGFRDFGSYFSIRGFLYLSFR